MTPIPVHPIDPPTLAMTISVNDSPYAGREGDKVQSRVIRERLLREAEGNVALKVAETGEGDFEVAGRGELQLGVLIESMRREGFELSISRPRVLFKTENGEKLEPIEEVTVDVDDRLYRHRHREDFDAQRRDDRHAPHRRRQDPHRLPRARRAA